MVWLYVWCMIFNFWLLFYFLFWLTALKGLSTRYILCVVGCNISPLRVGSWKLLTSAEEYVYSCFFRKGIPHYDKWFWVQINRSSLKQILNFFINWQNRNYLNSEADQSLNLRHLWRNLTAQTTNFLNKAYMYIKPNLI